jgi:hypothetical protein
MELEEVIQDVVENLDNAITYATKMTDSGKEVKEIIEAAEHLKTVIQHEEVTEGFANVVAWAMNLGAFISVIEILNPIAIVIAKVDEEEDDEPVH